VSVVKAVDGSDRGAKTAIPVGYVICACNPPAEEMGVAGRVGGGRVGREGGVGSGWAGGSRGLMIA